MPEIMYIQHRKLYFVKYSVKKRSFLGKYGFPKGDKKRMIRYYRAVVPVWAQLKVVWRLGRVKIGQQPLMIFKFFVLSKTQIAVGVPKQYVKISELFLNLLRMQLSQRNRFTNFF
jgi:hypothetical protein